MTTALNFSGRDFTAEFERLLALLKVELPEYTDWNHSDAGIVLTRLVARETDQNNEYIDRVASEGFIPTAQLRQSLIDLGRLVDFLPTLASAASTRLRFARAEGYVGAISVPQYSAFKRADGLSYLTASAVSIGADESEIEVNAIQGELVELSLEEADFSDELDWTNRPKSSLGVSVAAGTCEAWHGAGAIGDPEATNWVAVESFWRSSATDYHFLLLLDGDTDAVWIELGDGVSAAQAPPTWPLHVRFVRTAEAAGNCGAGTIYLMPDALDGQITCTNIEIATGGAPSADRETIRRDIPAVTRTQRRGLTCPDYDALIDHMAGVLHVQAIDRETQAGSMALRETLWGQGNAYGWPHEYIVLVVVPEGGGPMTTLLKDQIWAQCASWGHLGPWRQRYILTDAITVPINVAMRIGVVQGYSPEAVRSAVIAAVQSILAVQSRTIGQAVTFAELHLAASAVAGVSWVEFDAPTTDTLVPDGHIAVPGTITATVA